MTRYYLNPKKKAEFAELIGRSNNLDEARTNWISMIGVIMDLGYYKSVFALTGNKRRRKKKVQQLVKQVFTEKFLDCLVDQEGNELC